MTTWNLRQPPSSRQVAATQLRFAAGLYRNVFLVLGSLVILWVAVAVVLIAPVIDELRPAHPDAFQEVREVRGLITMIPWLGVIFALFAWRGEGPGRRAYHWTQPVSRARHDLIRVAVGAVWMLPMMALFMVADVVILSAFGYGTSLWELPPENWLVTPGGALTIYLLVMVPVLLSDRPGVWTFGTIAGLLGLGTLFQLGIGDTWITSLWTGSLGLGNVIGQLTFYQPASTWGPALGFWLAVALIAVTAVGNLRREPTS